MRLYRRFRNQFILSIVATMAAVGLAIGPNFRHAYDPALAVLTATLVAVIWYTFFSYCALHQVEEARLTCTVDRRDAFHPRRLRVTVANPTHSRTITFVWRVMGRRAGEALPIPGDLTDSAVVPLMLRPGERRGADIDIAEARGKPDSRFGPAVEMGEPQVAILRVDVAWEDDLGERGALGPDYWTVGLLNADTQRCLDLAAAEREWAGLGGDEWTPLALETRSRRRTLP